MFLIDFLFVFVFALIFTGIFVGGFRRQTEWGDLALFFLLILLLTWAFGGWFPAFGPMIWGVVWIPFFITALLVTLLLTAFIEPGRPKTPMEAVEEEQTARKSLVVVDAFFWILLIGLVGIIVYRYLN